MKDVPGPVRNVAIAWRFAVHEPVADQEFSKCRQVQVPDRPVLPERGPVQVAYAFQVSVAGQDAQVSRELLGRLDVSWCHGRYRCRPWRVDFRQGEGRSFKPESGQEYRQDGRNKDCRADQGRPDRQGAQDNSAVAARTCQLVSPAAAMPAAMIAARDAVFVTMLRIFRRAISVRI